MSALKDIGSDIIKGEIPLDKIAKMAYEGGYNGLSIATNKYVKEKVEKVFPDKKYTKAAIKGLTKSVFGTGKDVLFNKEKLLKAAWHNTYKNLINPFEEWKEEKFKGKIFRKHLLDGAQKTVVDKIFSLVDGKEVLIKPNGEFNNEILNDLVKDFKANEKKELISAIDEYLKKDKKKKEEKK